MSAPIIVGDGVHELDKMVAEIGVAFAGYTIVADDGGAPPNVYDVDFGPLTGLAVNAGSGAITGTPTNQAGTNNLILKATNDDGETGTRVLKLYLSPNGKPSITSPLWQEAIAGEPFTYEITGSHAAALFGTNGMPPWLDFIDASTISGVIPSSGPAQIVFKIRGSADAGVTFGAYADLTIDVDAGTGGAPVITNDPLLVNLEVGDSLSFQIEATNNPTSYALEDEPAGVEVDPDTGLVTSGAFGEATTFTFTIGATNASGNGQAQLTVIVVDNSVPPPGPTRNIYPYVEKNAHAEETRDPCANATTGEPPLPPSNLNVVTPGVRGSTTAIATWGNP